MKPAPFQALLFVLLLAACASEQEPAEPPEQTQPPADTTVTFQVTGDREFTVDVGEWATAPGVALGGEAPAQFYTIVLHPYDQLDPAVMFTRVPFDLEPGEHDLGDAESMLSARFTWGQQVVYDQNVEGTLTIEEAGDTVSGRFRFAATRGGAAGSSSVPPSIAVTGMFRAIVVPPEPADNTEETI